MWLRVSTGGYVLHLASLCVSCSDLSNWECSGMGMRSLSHPAGVAELVGYKSGASGCQLSTAKQESA